MSFVEVMVGEHTPIKDLIVVIRSTCNPDVLNKIENLPQSNNELVIAELDWRWKVLLAQKFILTEDRWPVRLIIELINETCDPDVLTKIEKSIHSKNSFVHKALNLRWRALKEQNYISTEEEMPRRCRKRQTI